MALLKPTLKNASTFQVILMLTILFSADAYMSGAPRSACVGMTPGHGVAPQMGSSGVTISMSSDNYTCGDVITVTLSKASFKGFLCQARLDPMTYQTTGLIEGSKNECDQPGSVTHSDGNVKTEQTFVWKPNENAGNVTIVCTIVRDYNTFWVGETSSVITNIATTDCSSGNHSTKTVPPITTLILLLFIIVTNYF